MSKHLYSHRKFINPTNHGSVASIHTEVNPNYDDKKKPADYVVNVSDCNRTISIHGNCHTKESRKVALFKIKTMIDVLQKLHNYLSKFDEVVENGDE